MVERVSALAGYFKPGQYGRPGTPGVTIELVPNLELWQLAAWPDTVEAVAASALQLIGVSSYSHRRNAGFGVRTERGSLLRVQPLVWWILGVNPPPPDPDTGTSVDLSHSRTCLRISGESAPALLNRFVSLDLRDPRLRLTNSQSENAVVQQTAGRVMSTAIHHVGVTLWETPEGYELFIPRGFAVSLLELLCLGAEQFGYELR